MHTPVLVAPGTRLKLLEQLEQFSLIRGSVCLACRRVLTALQRPAWSQANHRDFPPTFRATVRAFLLAEAASARRCQQQQEDAQEQQQQGPDGPALAGTVQQAGHLLGDLPVPLLERVLGLAAYPLSAWL